FGQRPVLLLATAWLVLLIFFLLVEWKSPQPMIDLGLFRNRLFNVNLLTGFATFISMSGTIILIPFYLENVMGYSPRAVGLLLAVVPVAVGITAPLSGALSDRVGTRPIAVAGLAMIVLGFVAVSTLSLDTTAAGYVLRYLPVGIGIGIFQSPNNSAVMGAVPRERLGIASGLLSITRTLGQTTGISVLGALWASRVAARAGSALAQGATAAPAAAQVAGLNDTFRVVIVLLSLALMLAAWGLVQERRMRALAAAQSAHTSRAENR
ncbi:MAG: MFS transporter, partial [Anaerolineaceae bacterium]|nr:MFS transporter [Anaerolineaceae bacterium]